ncbi:MAG TPA: hypothetical protein VE978_02805 [Chitinophagales bacterium]|nr:hypothetical protein [Chitinophagales bacterium]
MNKVLKFTIYFLLFITPFASNGQVLMKEMLTQDQKGTVDKSVNWPGKKIYYVLKYDSLSLYKFETYTTNRYYYTLSIADNATMTNAIKVPCMVRDLVVKTYFEFYFDNGTETKTFTALYEKYEKWYRIKFAPQWGCRRQEEWRRVNDIASYEQLLSSIVGQMDNNLKLDCYAGHEAKIPNQ